MAWTAPRTWTITEFVTKAMLDTHVRDNLIETWHEVAYVEYTTTVSGSGTNEGTATQVVSSGAVTYAAVPTVVEFFAPHVAAGAVSVTINLSLFDAASSLGIMGYVYNDSANINQGNPVFLARRFTPSAASHTYLVKVWVTSNTGNVIAGAGGANTLMPGYIRVWQKGG